jgi:hypothetical protein
MLLEVLSSQLELEILWGVIQLELDALRSVI